MKEERETSKKNGLGELRSSFFIPYSVVPPLFHRAVATHSWGTGGDPSPPEVRKTSPNPPLLKKIFFTSSPPPLGGEGRRLCVATA